MMFKPDTPLYSYEVIRESSENVMYVNYLGANFVPSLIDSPIVMARTLDNLREDSNVSRIVFVQQRNYSHDFEQVKMLIEVSNLFEFLTKQERIVSAEKLSHLGKDYYAAYALLNHILNDVLKQDGLFLPINGDSPGICYHINVFCLAKEFFISKHMKTG